ncbi:diaminopimelate epimerase, partial [bacterium]
MQKVEFSKVVGSGNDFIVIALSRGNYPGLKNLAQEICDRKYGVGADGLLVLDKVKNADLRMRIFNADGSEAEMCGNGARCAALWWANSVCKKQNVKMKIKTKAGIIESEVKSGNIKIKLTDPKAIKMDIPLAISGRKIKVNFINTGVPHTVVFVEGLDKIDVFGLGRQIRRHKYFSPSGTNVNFVEICAKDLIRART